MLQNPLPLGPSVEVTFVPSYPGESILYGSTSSGFPQLWCASNTTYSAYGILFFKPIDEVLSIMIQFQVGGPVCARDAPRGAWGRCANIYSFTSCVAHIQSKLGETFELYPPVSHMGRALIPWVPEWAGCLNPAPPPAACQPCLTLHPGPGPDVWCGLLLHGGHVRDCCAHGALHPCPRRRGQRRKAAGKRRQVGAIRCT